MPFTLKSSATFPGSQAIAEPSRSVAEQAILDMPELVFWARGDTRDPTQSRTAFRDLASGALIQGYGSLAVGSGINGNATMKSDGTPTSRSPAVVTVPPSFSFIALHRPLAFPPGSPGLAPLISDANFNATTNPMIGWGYTPSGYMDLKLATSGALLADATAAFSLNTNYISWCSLDGGTLAAAAASVNHRSAQATGTFGSGVSGASTMIFNGGGTFFVLDAEISDFVILSVPIGEVAYATQRDNVLNYLATKSGITLGS
jgi:hypothetical protein